MGTRVLAHTMEHHGPRDRHSQRLQSVERAAQKPERRYQSQCVNWKSRENRSGSHNKSDARTVDPIFAQPQATETIMDEAIRPSAECGSSIPRKTRQP